MMRRMGTTSCGATPVAERAGCRARPARGVSRVNGVSSVPRLGPVQRQPNDPAASVQAPGCSCTYSVIEHRSLILQTLSSDGEWILSARAGSWAGAAAGAGAGAGAAAGASLMVCPLVPNPRRAAACSLCSWRSWRSCCSLFCKSRYALRLARLVSERRTDSSS